MVCGGLRYLADILALVTIVPGFYCMSNPGRSQDCHLSRQKDTSKPFNREDHNYELIHGARIVRGSSSSSSSSSICPRLNPAGR